MQKLSRNGGNHTDEVKDQGQGCDEVVDDEGHDPQQAGCPLEDPEQDSTGPPGRGTNNKAVNACISHFSWMKPLA